MGDLVCGTCIVGLVRPRILVEPLGFRSSYFAPKTYEWNVETASRSHRGKLGKLPVDAVPSKPFPAVDIAAGAGYVYVINDAASDGFRFERTKNRNGFPEAGIIKEEEARRVGFSVVEPSEDFGIIALCCRTFTDVMLIGIDDPAGIDATFTTRARRAAWTSFAALLISAASSYLMVERRELEVGLQRYASGDQPRTRIFMSDTLENGAGYVTELARTESFVELMAVVHGRQFAQRYEAHHCEGACYKCLKDYSNMYQHDILDWRLALDLAAVMTGRPIPDRRSFAFEQAQAFARVNGWLLTEAASYPVLEKGSARIVIAPALQASSAFPAQLRACTHRTSAFDLLRQPTEVDGLTFGSVQRLG